MWLMRVQQSDDWLEGGKDKGNGGLKIQPVSVNEPKAKRKASCIRIPRETVILFLVDIAG
jgi:hypothetical protein